MILLDGEVEARVCVGLSARDTFELCNGAPLKLVLERESMQKLDEYSMIRATCIRPSSNNVQ